MSGYGLTHQVLYSYLLTKAHCFSDDFRAKSTLPTASFMDFGRVACDRVKKEFESVRPLMYLDTGMRDLGLEQIFLCGSFGDLNMADPLLLPSILSWQDASGCFKSVQSAPHARLQMRNLLHEMKLEDGCLTHLTTVAIGALTIYLRRLMSNNPTHGNYLLIIQQEEVERVNSYLPPLDPSPEIPLPESGLVAKPFASAPESLNRFGLICAVESLYRQKFRAWSASDSLLVVMLMRIAPPQLLSFGSEKRFMAFCTEPGDLSWSTVTKLLEESFVRDFDATSASANLRAVRAIRNFIVASPMNKQLILNSELLRERIMSSTSSFAPNSDKPVNLKRELLGLYSSFLRDTSRFGEEMLGQTDFLNNLLQLVESEQRDEEFSLLEAALLFLKTLFAADDLDSDFESTAAARAEVAHVVFTEARITDVVRTAERLFSILQSSAEEAPKTRALKSALISLTKLLALLATDPLLAARMHHQGSVLPFAHFRVMATVCPHHSPLWQQPAFLIRKLDEVRPTACPDSNRTVARFALKLIFFMVYHVPEAFETFKRLFGATKSPSAVISCYAHLADRFSGCFLSSGPLASYTSPSPPTSRLRETSSDPSTYTTSSEYARLHGSVSAPSCDGLATTLASYTPVDAGGGGGFPSLAATADHATSILVGLLRGALCWRLTLTASDQRRHPDTVFSQHQVQRRPRRVLRAGTSLVTAVDKFGNVACASHGLCLSDDEIALKILQPLTQNALLLNGSRLTTWACRILILLLTRLPRLHRCLLYSCVFVVDIDEKVTCLLKALQSKDDYSDQVDFLEHLTPFAGLFACLASEFEDVRVRIGEMSMTKALIQLLISHPSLSCYTASTACLHFTIAVTGLVHALSRSVHLHYTLFHELSIQNFLIQVACEHMAKLKENSLHVKLVSVAASALVNLSLCRLPTFEKYQEQSIQLFNSLMTLSADECPADFVLTFQMYGVWGLCSVLYSASNTTKMEAWSAALVWKLITRCRQLLDSSSVPLVGSAPGSTVSPAPVDPAMRDRFLHKSLLFIRNLLADKHLSACFVSRLDDELFELLTCVFTSDGSVEILEEAFLVLSNLLANPDARCRFWEQPQLIDAIVDVTTSAKSVSLKGAHLALLTGLLAIRQELASSSDVVEARIGRVLSITFQSSDVPCHHRSRRSASRLRRPQQQQQQGATETGSAMPIGNPSLRSHPEVVEQSRRVRRGGGTEFARTSVVVIARHVLETIEAEPNEPSPVEELPAPPAASSPPASTQFFRRRSIPRYRVYRNRSPREDTESILSPTHSGGEPSEAEIQEARLELFGSISATSSDSSSASSPDSSPQSGLAEVPGVPKKADAASELDAPTSEPLLRLLRCWFSLLLEAQSSPPVGFGDGRRLRDHLDFYLLRADSGFRRHCLQARHRLVLGLQLLSAGSENIADTEEFGRRLSVALGTTFTPPMTATTTTTTQPSSVAASTNTDVSSAVLGPTATTETTHYSTTTTTTSGAVSEMDFEDD
ncbi:Armadillo repeat-containing protein 8 [Sparganum proliferum]